MAAGAQKVFTLLFQLQAQIGGNFNSSFTSAQNAARKLQSELSGINALQSKVNGYQKQAEAIEKSKTKLAALTEEQARLRQAMSQTEQPSEALRRAYERNARQIEQTNASIQFQSTLPARGATAKVHKNSCSNSHYCLKLSFFLPSPTSCCTPKPKVSTEDPSSIWCEPPGIFLSACGSRFLKESEALLADRRPCSQNARSCFHSDCPGNKTAGCPSPGP